MARPDFVVKEVAVQRSVLAALADIDFVVVSTGFPLERALGVVQFAKASGHPVRGVVWRQNVGAVSSTYNGKKRFTRFGIAGQPDITGILADGRSVSIEVKRPGGKPTGRQVAFQRVARALGAVAICVSSVETLVSELRASGIDVPDLC